MTVQYNRNLEFALQHYPKVGVGGNKDLLLVGRFEKRWMTMFHAS